MSHPSTWPQEVAQLRSENLELALQALASEGQAAEAYEAQLVAEAEAKALRVENSRLIEERDRALAWRDKDWQASQDNTALRARVEELGVALRPFSDIAGEMFARNFNKGEVVVALDTPEKANRLTFDDFLTARAALQQEDGE